MCNQNPQFRRWYANRLHGMHHAHHRCHDADCGHAIAEFGDHVRGHLAFVVMGFDFVVHQVFDFKGIHAAAHHQAQVVGEKLNDVMVGHNRRILGEQRAVFGRVNIALNRHQSFLADFGQQLVQECEHVHVQGLVVL